MSTTRAKSLSSLAAHPAVRVLGVFFLGAVLAVVAWFPMIDAYPNTPEGDGRTFLRMFNSMKAAFRVHHELPLWNPYECGGSPLWDDPESMAASPLIWATVGLSATTTMYVWNVVHLAIGFTGMWLLCRRELSLSRIAAFASACIYTFGVCHASQYAGAHAALISFLDVPLALFLWRGADKNPSKAVGLGILVALMFYDGATYPIPHTALLLGAETLTRVGSFARLKKIVKAGVITVVVGLGGGAARVLPLVDQFRSKHRVIAPDADHLLRWTTLKSMYTLREVHWWYRLPEQTYVWGEYDAYVGVIVVFMCFVGILFAGRKYAWMLALSLFVFIMMLGHFRDWAPWSLLNHHVFPFKSMRVSARFRLVLCIFIAAYVGVAMDRVPVVLGRFFGSRTAGIARTVVCGVALLGAGDVMGVAGELVATRFGGAPEHAVKASTRLFYEGPDMAAEVDQPLQNRGRRMCMLAWAFSSEAATWTGDVPQARAKDASVKVEVANRTQNTFTIDAVAERPGRILVNSGFERGWRSDVGTVTQENLLLAVDVPAGRHRIHLSYVPKGLYAGFAVSLVTFLGCTVYFVRRRIFRPGSRAEGLRDRLLSRFSRPSPAASGPPAPEAAQDAAPQTSTAPSTPPSKDAPKDD